MVAEDTEGLDERDMTSFLIEVRDLSQYGSVILTVDVIQQATIKPPNIITHENSFKLHAKPKLAHILVIITHIIISSISNYHYNTHHQVVYNSIIETEKDAEFLKCLAEQIFSHGDQVVLDGKTGKTWTFLTNIIAHENCL